MPDAEERAWLEPRLAHLLGLGEATAPDRQELFSAWRVFFERLAEQGPCVLVFEDLQWAEPGLLDFIDHVLEWSRRLPLYVVALSRPEMNAALAGASRNATALALEPLSDEAMDALLDGFVPGLPSELHAEILGRAEGVPLYAVETVRMLLDRGLLERSGDTYRPTGPIEELAVPETLHALLAARLDGLTPEERSLVHDASVLGKTFTKQGVAALSGKDEAEIESLLLGLVRKEVLTLQADARSPERGQFGFLQDLLKRVAYETLSKADRKTRHLAAARHLATAWADEHEIVEVVAAHYLEAYRLMPEAEDAAELKQQARDALARAGERAASLAATVEAAGVFAQAAELADDPLEEARLRERAGLSAYSGGDMEAARREFERAQELYTAAGATREAALVQAKLGNTEWQLHESEPALERLKGAYAVLVEGEPDEGFAAVAAELARAHFFMGDFEAAQRTIDAALEAAERLWLPETLSQGLNTAGLVVAGVGRWEQGYALIKRSLEIALENDLTQAALRAYNNLGDMLDRRDRCEEAIEVQEAGIALARKVGARSSEWRLLGEMAFMFLWLGRYDEARAALEQVPEHGLGLGASYALPIFLATIEGDVAEARRLTDATDIGKTDDADEQDRIGALTLEAMVCNAEGDHERALEAAMECVEVRLTSTSKLGWEEALVAAHALGRDELVRDLTGRIEKMPPGLLPPTLRAHGIRFRALLGDDPDQRFRAAAAAFREYGMVLQAAKVQTEHAEWLLGETARRGRPRSCSAEARGGVRAPAGKALARARRRSAAADSHNGRGRLERRGSRAMRCTACGTENEAGRKFCLECGSGLAIVCPSCGMPEPPQAKFCGECGNPFSNDEAPPPPPPPPPNGAWSPSSSPTSSASRTLSESRDSEEVRELLSRYFDTCRRLIELYGGTVEKFIGDAVMAVWGTPTATEDDAERAVRAALDLVAAVSALGDEAGEPELRARAGVLTGEAAVTVGAEGQGMVAGDLVNTASRIQSLSEPGTVLVGEPTRRATDQTIVYADAGSHELKGKIGLFQLSQALRVVSGARGSLKSTGLEAPFVGRDSELRRVKDLFHACVGRRQAAAGRRSRALPGSASRGSPGSSTSTWTGCPGDVLAPRPVPCVRRGRGLLGPGRHGPDARPDRRGRRACVGAREARRRRP